MREGRPYHQLRQHGHSNFGAAQARHRAFADLWLRMLRRGVHSQGNLHHRIHRRSHLHERSGASWSRLRYDAL
ncbi:hypothetical protein L596_013528 [Steinernema carpocapsae]|uniref:Uncharacterized protein n=1 Tax=Steinernema carpocapsae TaxID=34508 RepID=A0A4U5P1A8_STECR|nr:hypothetical protein L596_013528 [Steinernema carpocapsae]